MKKSVIAFMFIVFFSLLSCKYRNKTIVIYGSRISGPSIYICDTLYLINYEIATRGFQYVYGKIRKENGRLFFVREELNDSSKFNFFYYTIDSSFNHKNIFMFNVDLISKYKKIDFNHVDLSLIINEVDTINNLNYLLYNKLEKAYKERNYDSKISQIEIEVSDTITQIEFILKNKVGEILTNRYKFEKPISNTEFKFGDNLYTFLEAAMVETYPKTEFREKKSKLYVRNLKDENWSLYPNRNEKKICDCSLEVLYKEFKKDHTRGMHGFR